MVTISDVFEGKHPCRTAIVKVDGVAVWDYKIESSKLKLIWDPKVGVSDEYVTWGELTDYCDQEGFNGEVAGEISPDEFETVLVSEAEINFYSKNYIEHEVRSTVDRKGNC